jgi:hypothetical protein
MKIFEVRERQGAVQRFYAGKTEAMKQARECAAESGEPVNVLACTIMPGKAGIVALANGLGWQQSSEVVYTAKPRKRSSAQTSDDDIEGLM